MLVARACVKKKRNEGGHWRTERRLMESTVTANAIFEGTRQDNVFDSLLGSFFEAQTTLLQSQGFKMDFGGV